MSKNDFDEERMCRLNGKQPTARERWIAFYRLYRIASGRGAYQDMAAVECLHVMLPWSGWLRLVQTEEQSPSRTHVPAFLRKIILAGDKKRRLYGWNYHWIERDKHVATMLHEKGTEVTPTEVAEVRRKVIRMARDKAALCNISVPDDDDNLLAMLKSL